MLSCTRTLCLPKVVVVGTGWGGACFVKKIKPELVRLQVLSTRNHHILTPLLPQTTTGTLEFRAVCEPITRIQPALAQRPNRFSRCLVYGVNFDKKEVNCVSVGSANITSMAPVSTFTVSYDKLVLAHGAQPSTFGVPGAVEHALFLREVNEARSIRKQLVQNIMTANLEITTESEMKRLLHTVVVGGGPTGVEFAASLADFVRDDLKKISPDLVPYAQVTVLEAGEVFSNFDLRVRAWGKRRLESMGVRIVKGSVVCVEKDEVVTKDGEHFPCGLVVWSTGVGPSQLTKDLDVDRAAGGRIAINEQLQVLRGGKPIPDVYALGDCAANVQCPLPTLAAVASRQGTYLANKFNLELANKKFDAPYRYESLGSMVSLGNSGAVVELNTRRKVDIVGLKALYFWRSAYLSILGSWRNKLYVVVNWVGSALFGRDVTFIDDMREERMWCALAVEAAARQRPVKEQGESDAQKTSE
ncbi:putative NADH dehydrogenase [Trypanosoma vivax]|nr:putative NADH dehydrogenase [Trypanosoma vivax]